MRTLAVTAHPDDETLLAGTLRTLATGGHRVALVCVTRGDRGAIVDKSRATRETLSRVRTQELESSAALIGVSELEVLDYPDGRVSEFEEALRDDLQLRIQRLNPGLVFTFGPDGVTRNADHVLVGKIVTEFARDGIDADVWQVGLPKLLQIKLLNYFIDSYSRAEVPQGGDGAKALTPMEWEQMRERVRQVVESSPPDDFTYSVDVKDLLGFKAEVMKCHQTQPGMDLLSQDAEQFKEIFGWEFFKQSGSDEIPNSLSGRLSL